LQLQLQHQSAETPIMNRSTDKGQSLVDTRMQGTEQKRALRER